MGTLTDVYRSLIFYVFVQAIIVATSDCKDLLICPDSNMAQRTIDCGRDALIDVEFARAVYLGEPAQCSDKENIISRIIENWSDISCKRELSFYKCRGNHQCIVDHSMTNISLYCTDGSGNLPSEVVFVRYSCHEVNTTNVVLLPSNQSVSSKRVDVLSPNFPDTTPMEGYDITCTITPISNTSADLFVENKIISYNGKRGVPDRNANCIESVILEQEGQDDFKIACYTGYSIGKYNEESDALSGEQWKLQYQRPKESTIQGKFWIQFRAAAGLNNAPVDLKVSCENRNTTPTVVPTGPNPTDEKQDYTMWVIIGAVGFVVLVILIVIIAFCLRRRSKRNKEGEKSTTATSPPKEGTGVYCVAGAIDEKHGEANGNLQNENDKKTKKPNTYVNVEQPKVEYAEINVKKKSKKTDKAPGDEVKKAVDDETIMCENDTLYSSAKGNLGKVDYAEIKFPDSPIKGKGNGDKTGDAPYNDVL